MTVFVVITIIGGFIFLFFLALLIWSVRSGQLDDLKMPAERILWEDKNDS